MAMSTEFPLVSCLLVTTCIAEIESKQDRRAFKSVLEMVIKAEKHHKGTRWEYSSSAH
jgi:hypothetical protein